MEVPAVNALHPIDGGAGASPDHLEAQSLADRVYEQLRAALMRTELEPHQRLKIRDLAARLGTSETPVREALFQLVRDGAIELKPRHYVRVRRLSLAEYLEIRDIRLKLEPLAAERALPHVDDATLEHLDQTHRHLIAAEQRDDFREALQMNFAFHFGIYWRSGMPALIRLLENLWIQVGPLLNDLYPHGRPQYAGAHQHEHVLAALRRRDSHDLREAIRQDLLEGGRNFVRHLSELEAQADGLEDEARDGVDRPGRVSGRYIM